VGTAQITPSELFLSATLIHDAWLDADGCLSGSTEVAEVVPEADRPYVEALAWIKSATNLSQERIARLLGVTRQAIHLWEQGKALKDANRRRLLAVKDVLERASTRHPTTERLAIWLDTPRGADARTPSQLLEAGE